MCVMPTLLLVKDRSFLLGRHEMEENSDTDEDSDYGFVWGPLHVERLMIYRGRRVLGLKTRGVYIEIICSPRGRRVQIWAGKSLNTMRNVWDSQEK